MPAQFETADLKSIETTNILEETSYETKTTERTAVNSFKTSATGILKSSSENSEILNFKRHDNYTHNLFFDNNTSN
ncbi:unnamed protein product [Coregonus sp. 'balchen']|nr:unnamed protein product [Coregonus sp. 'balchen']